LRARAFLSAAIDVPGIGKTQMRIFALQPGELAAALLSPAPHVPAGAFAAQPGVNPACDLGADALEIGR
jgi:hypothetical protein